MWERAAQLQTEAAQRSEAEEEKEKSKGLRLFSGQRDESSGYSLSHVKQAGVEVGIDPGFVELALAEEAILDLEGGGESTFWDRTAEKYLADRGRVFEIVRDMDLPASLVWLGLEEELTSEAQGLELLEVLGGPVPEGGIAIFESPYSYEKNGSLQYWCTVAEVRRYIVKVLPVGDGCRVEIQAPVRRSHRVNGAVGMTVSGGIGVLGGLIGMGLAAGVAGATGLAVLPVGLALIGTGTLGGERLGRFGYIRAYRWGFRALKKAFARALKRIERDVEREQLRRHLLPEADA